MSDHHIRVRFIGPNPDEIVRWFQDHEEEIKRAVAEALDLDAAVSNANFGPEPVGLIPCEPLGMSREEEEAMLRSMYLAGDENTGREKP